MTTLCKSLALGQGECQNFVTGERLASCQVLKIDVVAAVRVVVVRHVAVPVEHDGGGKRRNSRGDQEHKAARADGGVRLADLPRLLGVVPDVLAAHRVNSGVEGVQEEDDHQECQADYGNGGPGDERRAGVSGKARVLVVVIALVIDRWLRPCAVFHASNPIGTADAGLLD